MNEIVVSFVSSHGEKLVGRKTLPLSEGKKFPAVLLVHGFGVDKDEFGMFVDEAAELAKNGFVVFRFDFSGNGESEGDYSKTSISHLKTDLLDMLSWVKEQPDVEGEHVGIHAQSFGTPVTVAAMPSVQALVLMGSISHPQEVSGRPDAWEVLDKKGVSRKTKAGGRVILMGPQFWSDMDNYDLEKNMSEMSCPLLVIHGEKDVRIPLSEAKCYFDAANGEKKMVVMPEAAHSMIPKRDEMYALVVDWFKKYLLSF